PPSQTAHSDYTVILHWDVHSPLAVLGHSRSIMPASSQHLRLAAGRIAEKRSLAAILRDHGPFSGADAVDVILHVCDELASARANGVVHGDLGIHRVRTRWPRQPGQPIDIFALGETDTAAFEARASAGSILVAPEQRDGRRAVDSRADVFAVGVMLHWLLSGVAPGIAPLSRTLARVPRPVAATIEACLANDPARRPQTMDDIAEALGSFSAAPPHQFAQLARRRLAQRNAQYVRSDFGEVDRAL